MEEKEREPIRLTDDDLASVREVQGAQNALLFDLGALQADYEARKHALLERMDEANRERIHVMRRLAKRYGIPEGERINLDNGEVG